MKLDAELEMQRLQLQQQQQQCMNLVMQQQARGGGGGGGGGGGTHATMPRMMISSALVRAYCKKWQEVNRVVWWPSD